jgi:hypothetical protein
MVVLPALTPDTTPAEDIVALAVLLLAHEPPDTVSLNVIVPPGQTLDEPDIAPAFGSGSIVIFSVAYEVLQPSVIA